MICPLQPDGGFWGMEPNQSVLAEEVERMMKLQDLSLEANGQEDQLAVGG